VTIPIDIVIDNLRPERDELLQLTDSWMASDRGLTQEQTDELLAYRQALRDFPATVNVEAIVWPLIPTWMV
jgi:hypothetical protein